MVEAQTFLERRAHLRAPIKIPVSYRLVEDPLEIENLKKRNADTRDLSLEGMYIQGGQMKVGDVIRLDISIPGKTDSLFAFAEVVRTEKTGAGLHLMIMESEDKETLKAYLDKASST